MANSTKKDVKEVLKEVKTKVEATPAAKAVKDAAAKVESTPAAKAVKDAATKAAKAPAVEKAKTAAKKAVDAVKAAPKKAAEKKPAAKKAAAPKKAAAKKPAAKKAAPAKKAEEIYVQFAGAEWSVAAVKESILADLAAQGHRASSVKQLMVYVKPEEGKAYYVVNGKIDGAVAL